MQAKIKGIRLSQVNRVLEFIGFVEKNYREGVVDLIECLDNKVDLFDIIDNDVLIDNGYIELTDVNGISNEYIIYTDSLEDYLTERYSIIKVLEMSLEDGCENYYYDNGYGEIINCSLFEKCKPEDVVDMVLEKFGFTYEEYKKVLDLIQDNIIEVE